MISNTLRFHHVALYVKSLAVSMPFYQTLFGFSIQRAFNKKDGQLGVVHLTHDKSQFVLELIEQEQDSPSNGTHLGFSISNLEGMLTTLKASNIALSRGPIHIGSERIIFIKDPDGHEIELNEGLE